jgi:hypothetical protein
MSPTSKKTSKKKKKEPDYGPFSPDEVKSAKKKPVKKMKKDKHGLFPEPWLDGDKYYQDKVEYKDALGKEPWLEREKFYQDQYDDQSENDPNSEYYYKKKKRKKGKYSDDSWEGMDV